ncbi:ATP-binding protein [candidate division KSB1 bacterium]
MNEGEKKYTIVIPSNLDKLADVKHLSEKVAGIAGFNSEQTYNISMAVIEAVSNAIVHGNKSDEKRKTVVDFLIGDDKVTATVRDQGNGFDPAKLANPVDPENIMKISGRGLLILRALTSDVKFNFNKYGTEIIMVMKK